MGVVMRLTAKVWIRRQAKGEEKKQRNNDVKAKLKRKRKKVNA